MELFHQFLFPCLIVRAYGRPHLHLQVNGIIAGRGLDILDLRVADQHLIVHGDIPVQIRIQKREPFSQCIQIIHLDPACSHLLRTSLQDLLLHPSLQILQVPVSPDYHSDSIPINQVRIIAVQPRIRTEHMPDVPSRIL